MGRIGFGVALFVLFALLAIGPPRPREDPQSLVGVLVARKRVPAFEALKEPEKWFKVVYYSKGDEPLDALTDFAQVKGQRLKRVLNADEPLQNANFLIWEYEPALPADTRAVALPVEPGLTSLFSPGTRVDVAVVTTAAGQEPSCKVVVEDLQFLANDSPRPTCVTVAATLPQCKQVAEAVRAGKLHLVLRPPTNEQARNMSAWVFAVPSDLRGVSVRYNPTSMGGGSGFILPGCGVDVIVSKETSDKEFDSITLMQDLLVLAVGRGFTKDDKDGNCWSVMLAVSKEQVEKLLAGTAEGDVRLILRSHRIKADSQSMSKTGDWKKPISDEPPPNK